MKAALVISDRDNVATALEPLAVGQTLTLPAHTVVVLSTIPSGHKIALVGIAKGQPVMKYGSPIGSATTDIEAGAHVHTHNLSSDRGRGDLQSAGDAPEPVARLAEPIA